MLSLLSGVCCLLSAVCYSLCVCPAMLGRPWRLRPVARGSRAPRHASLRPPILALTRLQPCGAAVQRVKHYRSVYTPQTHTQSRLRCSLRLDRLLAAARYGSLSRRWLTLTLTANRCATTARIFTHAFSFISMHAPMQPTSVGRFHCGRLRCGAKAWQVFVLPQSCAHTFSLLKR